MKAEASRKNKGLGIALWIVQGILALMFMMAGFMKSSQPIEQLSVTLPWTAQVPAQLVRFIGICELLGGIGLLLPSLLRIRPKLTPWAALGLATIMLFATIFHVVHAEAHVIGINIFLMMAALFVAWGRFKKVPIVPKP